MTFSEAARHIFKTQVEANVTPLSADQWRYSVETYVEPVIGDLPIDRITRRDVLTVLEPIWLAKAVTAKRVKQRINTVFEWAEYAGHCEGNPVRGVERALPAQRHRPQHIRALPYQDAPAAFAKIAADDNLAARALAFKILTATRSTEVLGARWLEIDGDVWTIPAERMKARVPHRVPLSTVALAILEDLPQVDDLLFPSPIRRGRPLVRNALTVVHERLAIPAAAHGWRSTFRDWAAEESSAPHFVAEMALAHKIKSAVERAYRRGDVLEKRRVLAEEWARFVTSNHSPPG